MKRSDKGQPPGGVEDLEPHSPSALRLSPTSFSSRGLPVALGDIDCQLKRLWKEGEGVASRASLINFAVYCRGEAAMDHNTVLIAELMQNHACRALLIALEPEATKTRVQAWISAHCHVSRAGAKQTCCEQISFLLEGDAHELVPGIVFSHLDSDLPLYFWWQGEFSGPMDCQLLANVDRLIFDSQSWSQPAPQLRLLRESFCRSMPHLILCDLNWTRLLPFRQGFAQLFDSPVNRARLENLQGIHINHAPDYRSTAALLVAWLLAQWTRDTANPSAAETLLDHLNLEFSGKQGPPISSCLLDCGDAQFCVGHEPDSKLLHVTSCIPDGCQSQHLLAPAPQTTLALLDAELMRGGNRQVYLRALHVAGKLW